MTSDHTRLAELAEKIELLESADKAEKAELSTLKQRIAEASTFEALRELVGGATADLEAGKGGMAGCRSRSLYISRRESGGHHGTLRHAGMNAASGGASCSSKSAASEIELGSVKEERSATEERLTQIPPATAFAHGRM